jgi:hypothetical protein
MAISNSGSAGKGKPVVVYPDDLASLRKWWKEQMVDIDRQMREFHKGGKVSGRKTSDRV